MTEKRIDHTGFIFNLFIAIFGALVGFILTWFTQIEKQNQKIDKLTLTIEKFTSIKMTEETAEDQDAPKAGCLITIQNPASESRPYLMIGILDRETGKFGPPAGRRKDKDITDTRTIAKNLTFNETGLEVDVLHEAEHFEKKNFTLFHCALKKDSRFSFTPVPEDEKDVSSVIALDPRELPKDAWRYPEQAGIIQNHFEERKEKMSHLNTQAIQ